MAAPRFVRHPGHVPGRRWASRQLLARQINGLAPIPLRTADGRYSIGEAGLLSQLDGRRNHPRIVRMPGHEPWKRWASRRVLARQANNTIPVPLVDTTDNES